MILYTHYGLNLISESCRQCHRKEDKYQCFDCLSKNNCEGDNRVFEEHVYPYCWCKSDCRGESKTIRHVKFVDLKTASIMI